MDYFKEKFSVLIKNKLLVFIIVLTCLNSCKKENKIEKELLMDITKKKWLVCDKNFQSTWNLALMPTTLNFENEKLALNFSNTFQDFKIVDNKLYLDGKPRFIISDFEGKLLTLQNKDESKDYISIEKGDFTDLDKSTLENILSSHSWIFKDMNAEFKDSSLDFYDNNDEFIKGGLYKIFLYNNVLIMFINIDGSQMRETYIVNDINKDKIKFKRLLGYNDYENVDIIAKK